MQTMGYIGVVIPTYLRFINIKKVISSIEKQTYVNFYVVIADSACDEKLKSYIDELKERSFWRRRIMYISCGPRRIGRAARSRNIGIANLPHECEIVLLLDSDVVIREDYLENIIKIYSNNPNNIILSKTFWLAPEQIKKYEQVNNFTEMVESQSFQSPKRLKGTFVGYDLRLLGENNPFMEENKIIPFRGEWLVSNNIVIPKTLYKLVGPFNEEMKGYGYEDIEYGLRLQDKKAMTFILNKVTGLHLWHSKKDEKIIHVQNQINLHYVYKNNLTHKEIINNADWHFWWHYTKQTFAKIFIINNELWVFNEDMTERMKIEKRDINYLGFIYDDLSIGEDSLLDKSNDNGKIDHSMDQYIYYMQTV